MFLPNILIFAIGILVTWLLHIFIGNRYLLDEPGERKKHDFAKPQIGGLVFGPLLLVFCWFFSLAPIWYIFGGIITIILGFIDDNHHIPWYIKLVVQLFIGFYLISIFWSKFDSIIFYNFSLQVSQLTLLCIFIIWFIGIYNAVNLIDGLDGLAGGFVILTSIGLAVSGSGLFFQLNGLLAIILLSFLVFNQRPASLFMGDSGSLFLGYHIAVLPLLFYNQSLHLGSIVVTPFILLASYLIADTTRVFFTRLVAKKSPMTADTIHFHHLLLRSGSYISSISIIYLLTILSVIATIFSFNISLSTNVLLGHLALLLIFILVPPVETYVPLITQIISPIYNWQKKDIKYSPHILRTLFMTILFLGFIFSIIIYCDLSLLFDLNHALAFSILTIYIILNKKSIKSLYVIKLSLLLLFVELYWFVEISTLTKLFSVLLTVSYLIFTIEKRIGCYIREFSSLDILIILFSSCGIILSTLGLTFSSWFSVSIFALWFTSSFILRRLNIYYN